MTNVGYSWQNGKQHQFDADFNENGLGKSGSRLMRINELPVCNMVSPLECVDNSFADRQIL